MVCLPCGRINPSFLAIHLLSFELEFGEARLLALTEYYKIDSYLYVTWKVYFGVATIIVILQTEEGW